MTSKREKLRAIAERLTREGLSIGDQIRAVNDLSEFFTELVDVGGDNYDPDEREPTRLADGIAIGPWQAARCVREFRRTVEFIGATRDAIETLFRRFPGETIEIVYAGCGPFGTILVPVLTLIDTERINATFIDIHKRSLESVRTIIDGLGLSGDNIGLVEADAAKYVHGRRPHLVISETMQNALQKEMQVPIGLNLGPQIEPGGIFVPEEISIDAIFARPVAEAFSAEAQKERIPLGEICRFDPLRTDADAAIRRPVRLTVPLGPNNGYCFALSTSIRVFGSRQLPPRSSSITNFQIILELSDLVEEREVEFRYELGAEPGYRWRFV